MHIHIFVFTVLLCIKSVFLYCGPYNGQICKSYSTGHVWYNETGDLDNEKITTGLWEELILTLTEPCRSRAEKFLCAYAFPKCASKEDVGYSALPLCHEDCMAVKMQFCYNEWLVIEERKLRGIYFKSKGHFQLPDCEKLPKYSGKGSQLTCNYVGSTEMEKNQVTTSCYRGTGRYYQGTVNVTETGLTCQAWESQTPHQHTRPPLVFPEVNNSSNYCRNAGGEERKPWCYTTNQNVRWEYCDIQRCANGSKEFNNINEPSIWKFILHNIFGGQTDTFKQE